MECSEVRKIGDVQICNRYNMKVFSVELCHHSCEVGKPVAIDSKGAILLLEIDVEINCIGRNVIGPQAICDLNTRDCG